ncbi:MAG: hypothetical protein LUH02_03700 [Erysipelotrichaceae bacterium]|nr:hypothetical protein [Erysipelotrichaceae bacterium]
MLNENEIDSFFRALSALKVAGINNNVVLVGSWVEMFYEEYLDDFNANIKTTDIDFLYLNLNNPSEKVYFTKIMNQHGFIYDEDYMTNKTKFYDPNLEIEFLSKLTRQQTQTVKVQNLGIYVECLGGLELLEHNYFSYYSYKYNMNINIPKPAAYCMHKILINNTRAPAKAKKDSVSLQNLLPIVLINNQGSKDFDELYNSLSKKQLSNFKINIKNMNLEEIINSLYLKTL